MTKFTDCSGTEKKGKETVFTYYLNGWSGWRKTQNTPKKYQEVKYLGHCNTEGDIFACYNSINEIIIYKGTKGDEF